MVCFAQPFRKAESGDDIVARFSFRTGSINVTGVLLLQSQKREHKIAFTNIRTERVFFTTKAARDALTRLAVAHRQTECRIGAQDVALNLKSQITPVAKAPQIAASPQGVVCDT